MWGSLDDGSAIPSHKMFENATYDHSTRTFRGEIHWPVPICGEGKWVYTMVFDKHFRIIEEGTVQTYDVAGKAAVTQRFCEDLFYQRLITLGDLIDGHIHQNDPVYQSCKPCHV